jgi:hypothetical protein
MQRKITFAIPAGAGAFAPEILYLAYENSAKAAPDLVSEMSAVLETLPAGASLEVDILKVGGDPAVDADYNIAVRVWNALGLQTLFQLAKWRGVRVRGKSDGTAGNLTLDLSWW